MRYSLWKYFYLLGVVAATYVIVVVVIYNQVERDTQELWPIFAGLGSSTTATRSSTASSASSSEKIISVNGTDYFRVCLLDPCMDQVASQLARPFSTQSKDGWCIEGQTKTQQQSSDNVLSLSRNAFNDNTHQWQGLLLVKVPKAASSTCAGVVLRIARQQQCTALQWQHKEGFHFQNRSQQHHFLVGSIRQPAQRAFSSVWFFQLAPLNITPTDENVIRALNTRRAGKTVGKGGYQYNYLSIERVIRKSLWDAEQGDLIMNHPSRLYQRIQQLINTYHFIIVIERMEESLVVLALLLGIPLSNVLVPSSKAANHHGNFYQVRVGRRKGQCVKPRKEPMSPNVQLYLNSKTWLAMNYADEILYRAANASLDRTIDDVIGRDRFRTALKEYRRLKILVQNHCGPLHGTGCTKDGTPIPEPCYDRDFGCGYQCLDEALNRV